ncbi:AAA family ATPase [Nitratidesulfovibrio sp. HK-II]|uniref:AAA family ATPase n=1 Tax=Nitratidesulfovibrio sp. HK-II TaxID=2009266 RepID=UPI000E2EB07B|nr:AAA family ATPase [Nitratidesulfovibrio sp. HK-II]GBO95326.1 general secretion pathway protein A [Nitratidesulfovibrio sp. HK-II]
MNYLELLGLSREPFSTSPDPLSYYRAPGHELCLHRLEIAVRLRRGLNVVLGEVGTGKSTLCRCLLRAFAEQPEVTAHLILDPGFASAEAFALHLCELLAGPSASPAASPAGGTSAKAAAADTVNAPDAGIGSMREDDGFGPTPAHITVSSAPAHAPGDAARAAPGSELRREAVERIQTALLRLTQEQGRIVVLCIDEGQKLLPECLEVLRELLNFETNTEKLLQIILFGQRELEDTIAALPNFRDRINEYLPLRPLSPRETIRLVRHRLRLAGGPAGERLFTLPALLAVHRATGGYPRKIMRLCHQLVMNLLINNRRRVTWREVNAFASRDAGLGGRLETGPAGLVGLAVGGGPGPLRVAGYVALAALLLGAGMWTGGHMLRGGELHLPWAAKGVQVADVGMAGSTPAPAEGAADGGMVGFFRPLLASLGLSGAETGTGTGKDAAPANAPGAETRASASARPQAATPAMAGPATAALPGAGSTGPTGATTAPPARLGMVVLPRGETLLSLLDAVYGRAAAVLDAVLQANPAITNPNRLPSDTILALPAIATEPGMERRGQCALLLESHPTVEEAYRALRAKGGGKRDVVLAPVWKPDRGLRFYLMPPRFYAKPAEAHAAAERLFQRFPAATVEPAFGDGAVFYRHFD